MLPGEARCQETRQGLWGQRAGGLGTSKGRFSTFVWEMLMVENWRKRWRRGQPRNHCDGSKVSNHHGHSAAPQPWVVGRAQPWPSSLPRSHNNLETSTLQKKKRASSTQEDNPIKRWSWDSSPGCGLLSLGTSSNSDGLQYLLFPPTLKTTLPVSKPSPVY